MCAATGAGAGTGRPESRHASCGRRGSDQRAARRRRLAACGLDEKAERESLLSSLNAWPGMSRQCLNRFESQDVGRFLSRSCLACPDNESEDLFFGKRERLPLGLAVTLAFCALVGMVCVCDGVDLLERAGRSILAKSALNHDVISNRGEVAIVRCARVPMRLRELTPYQGLCCPWEESFRPRCAGGR